MTEVAGAPDQSGSAIRIHGIAYVPVEDRAMTFKHRLATTAEIRASGLRPLEHYEALPTAEDRGLAILADVYNSGHAFTLLATLFVRAGEPWRAADVPTVAAAFESAAGEEADALTGMLSATLVGLFSSGSRSLPTSPTSSPEPTKRATPSDSPAAPSTITGSSTPSSASSPATTRRGTTRSRAGRSAKGSSATANDSGPTPASATSAT